MIENASGRRVIALLLHQSGTSADISEEFWERGMYVLAVPKMLV